MKTLKLLAEVITQPKAIFLFAPEIAVFGLSLVDSALNYIRVAGWLICGIALTVLATIWLRETRRKQANRNTIHQANETSSATYHAGGTFTIVIDRQSD